MFDAGTDKLLATTEQMLVHVDMNAGRSAAILPEVRAALDAIAESHSHLPMPDRAGHFSLKPE
jgi:acyl-CoA thioesterase FadM